MPASEDAIALDRSVGGGRKLKFGKFREEVEQAVKSAGWEFLYEVF